MSYGAALCEFDRKHFSISVSIKRALSACFDDTYFSVLFTIMIA